MNTNNQAIVAVASKKAQKITWLGVAINILLAVLKVIAGMISGSPVLIADAAHSLSDLISDFITLWAIKVAQKPKDEDHPYGHGKFEDVGSFLVSIVLIFTGLSVGLNALNYLKGFNLFDGTKPLVTNSNVLLMETGSSTFYLVLLVIVFSILSKEMLYQLSYKLGTANNSKVLIANAWHHRSDALSSILALLGVVFTVNGYPLLDPIMAALVAFLIVKNGGEIALESFRELTDRSVKAEVINTLNSQLKSIEGVVAFHEVRARRMGPYITVDLHIQVDSLTSVSAAHQVAERVRINIMNAVSHVSEVLVHVDAEQDIEPTKVVFMRPQKEVEKDIIMALAPLKQVEKISHILCHYLNNQLTVQVSIVVSDFFTIRKAKKIAQKCEDEILKIKDINEVDIHLELE